MSAKGVNPKPEHPFIHPIVQVRLLIIIILHAQINLVLAKRSGICTSKHYY